jgi:DNA-binding NarL/FixJ family response regulator
MPDLIRILVADDHPVVRDGLVAMLGTQPDFEVVAEAASGPDTVQKAASFQPDLLLLDLEMPGALPLPGYPGAGFHRLRHR